MGETWRLLLGSQFTVHGSRLTTTHNSQLSTLNSRLEAAMNMAVDEAIVMSYRKGGMSPTLRLYTWREPALTIGYFQAISEELDWASCETYKVPVVRRITGGRAVLHGHDLTYSVIAGPGSSIFPTQNIRETFLIISHAFVWALSRLGLKVEAVESSSKNLKSASGGPLCFASPSWYEITCEGRKVIGSAQRRWREGFLQQGSVLFEFDPEEFYRLFRFQAENRRLEMIKDAKTKVAGLNHFMRWPLSYREVEEALVTGFEQALGVVLKSGMLTPEETETARHLALEKYSQDAWNRKRAPLPSI